MNIQKFMELVEKNQIFSVKFIKKDNTERVMRARLGVKKYVKGTKPEATEKRKETLTDNNMVGVYEMKGKTETPEDQYRTINLNTLIEVHVGGHVFNKDGEMVA